MPDIETSSDYLQLIRGDYTAANPDMLYTDSLTQGERDAMGLAGDTAAYIQKKLDALNVAMKNAVGSIPPSPTSTAFLDVVTTILLKLVFFLDAAGMPQVKIG
jgi:hypothetical protein